MANKANDWTVVTFDEIDGWRKTALDGKNLPAIKLARALGFSNSTYHNWKSGRAVPNQVMQEKLRALIDGKEKLKLEGSSAPTKAANKGSGKGSKVSSQTLDDLRGGKGKGKTKVSKGKTQRTQSDKPKNAKTTKKKTTRRVSKGARKRTPADDRRSSSWVGQIVGNYLENNPVTTEEELVNTLRLVNEAVG